MIESIATGYKGVSEKEGAGGVLIVLVSVLQYGECNTVTVNRLALVDVTNRNLPQHRGCLRNFADRLGDFEVIEPVVIVPEPG